MKLSQSGARKDEYSLTIKVHWPVLLNTLRSILAKSLKAADRIAITAVPAC
jgi:hypothetical protein